MKSTRFKAASREKVFSQLCGNRFFRAFVFHSPKYQKTTAENEAGDVVIWVREKLIVFEIISKHPGENFNIKNFVKRFGEKRRQLVECFNTYGSGDNTIEMVSELGQKIIYSNQHFDDFFGVVLIDSEEPLVKMHYGTFEKTLENDFPIAFLTLKTFKKILSEIDTPIDLTLYLHDRREFLRKVFHKNPGYFLNLEDEYELDLIGLYKINENNFNIEQWNESDDKKFWDDYQLHFSEKIEFREEENRETTVIDEILNLVIFNNPNDPQTVEHSWELGMLTRRARAGVYSDKLQDAIYRIHSGLRKERYFALYNQLTGCWSLYFFYKGDDKSYFEEKAKTYTRMKMYVERVKNDFNFTVFCFAFRKSSANVLERSFDQCFLWLEDAENHKNISQEQFEQAKIYFAGSTGHFAIKEFPDAPS